MGSLPRELAEQAPGYQTLPRARTSKFSTPKPTPPEGQWNLTREQRVAWEAEQASAFLIPDDILAALEAWAMKAPDERQRCGRLEAVVWWRKWVRKANGSLEQVKG